MNQELTTTAQKTEMDAHRCGDGPQVTEIDRLKALLQVRDRQLQEANAEFEHLIYLASHDLREPLRKIRGFSNLLTERGAGDGNESAAKYLRIIQESGLRMQDLLEGLTEYSRIVSQPLQPSRCVVDDIVDVVLQSLEYKIMKSNARVTIDPMPIVTANRRQLKLLLYHLIDNAIKFTDVDQPLVKLSAETGTVSDFCTIHVEDNGIGIAERYHERIFQMFQRLHPRDTFGGIGIGLTQCRKIVTNHGGTIAIATNSMKGTTVSITLPGVPDA